MVGKVWGVLRLLKMLYSASLILVKSDNHGSGMHLQL